jgi:hypothetical protein
MSTSNETYYSILNVNSKANIDEIKKAYKLQALKWHPDRVPDSCKAEATERFQKISEAYQVLCNKNKRREYDQNSNEGVGASTEEVPLSADDLFKQECGELFEHIVADITAQRGEGESRVASIVGWSVFGGVVGYGLGMIFFAPAVIPAAISVGAAGALKGYTDKDVATVVTAMEPSTKRKILELMLKKQQQSQ